MTEKITGYSLLILGVSLIVISLFSVFLVFTGQAQPVKPFNFSGVSLDLGSQLAPGLVKNTAPAEIIPAAMINDSANLFAHMVLMGFIASIGQKLASLGIQLVRPVVVKLNEQKQ